VNAGRRKALRVKAGLVSMLFVLPMAACGGAGDEPAADKVSAAEPPVPASVTHAGHGSANAVEMRLIQFQPKQITLAAGTEVTWTQSDAGFHTVTSGTVEQAGGGVTAEPDGKFRSERLATGESFKFTFDQPGTYAYFCEIHPATMTGEVIVG
jgi:plastocyanin